MDMKAENHFIVLNDRYFSSAELPIIFCSSDTSNRVIARPLPVRLIIRECP